MLNGSKVGHCRRPMDENAARRTNGRSGEAALRRCDTPSKAALGRSCYSGVTLFCIIKGDLRLLCPRQCCTIAEVDFGYGDGVALVDQPLQDLRREISQPQLPADVALREVHGDCEIRTVPNSPASMRRRQLQARLKTFSTSRKLLCAAVEAGSYALGANRDTRKRRGCARWRATL